MPRTHKALVPIDHTVDMVMDALDNLDALDQDLQGYFDQYVIPETVVPSFSYARRALATARKHFQSAKVIADSLA